jgi:hypothetical protein
MVKYPSMSKRYRREWGIMLNGSYGLYTWIVQDGRIVQVNNKTGERICLPETVRP